MKDYIYRPKFTHVEAEKSEYPFSYWCTLSSDGHNEDGAMSFPRIGDRIEVDGVRRWPTIIEKDVSTKYGHRFLLVCADDFTIPVNAELDLFGSPFSYI